MREVAPERTGWRDSEISLRHRKWGYNCPAVDLDFVMAEYNHGKPVAIVEYKHRCAQEPQIGHPTYQALTALADGYTCGALPFFVAIYYPPEWYFRVIPVNEAAKAYYKHVLDEYLTEQRFVKSLYVLRKRVLTREDEDAISALNDTLPDGDPPRN